MRKSYPKLRSIRIKGYRPFRDFMARFGSLEVLVGANGSGKSSLFEFLKFLRDSSQSFIPSEIVAGSIGQFIFHRPGPDKFWWSLEIDMGEKNPLLYQGQVLGPVGRTHVSFERIVTKPSNSHKRGYLYMNVKEREGLIQDPISRKLMKQEIRLKSPNLLALSTVTNPKLRVPYQLREFISGWRFYSSFNINNTEIRKSVTTAQEPQLAEDARNLSSVLHFLMTEHNDVFQEIQLCLRSAIPGFKNLKVLARGGPGEVIGFWEEDGVEQSLSLADLSDGILRFLCWIVICLHPKPPGLVCIDEPDQGVHPRTLPILSSLIHQLSERTQVMLATHSSYFLTQFELKNLAVTRKVGGEAKFFKPNESKILIESLKEFGVDEVEKLHRSDELETFSSEIKS